MSKPGILKTIIERLTKSPEPKAEPKAPVAEPIKPADVTEQLPHEVLSDVISSADRIIRETDEAVTSARMLRSEQALERLDGVIESNRYGCLLLDHRLDKLSTAHATSDRMLERARRKVESLARRLDAADDLAQGIADELESTNR